MSAQSERAGEAISHQIGEGDIPEPVRAFIQERIATELAVSADLYTALEEMLAFYEVVAGEDECGADSPDYCSCALCKEVGCVVDKAQRTRTALARARGEQP